MGDGSIDQCINFDFDSSNIKIEDCKIPDKICFILKNVLTTEETANLIKFSEKTGYKSSDPYYPPTYRNNLRQVIDNTKLSEKLFKRVEKYIPQNIHWKNHLIVSSSENDSTKWNLYGLNERFRSCKYLPNQFFRYHQDGEFWRSNEIQSKLTFMLYLNDDFEGGFTNFLETPGHEAKIICSVKPIRGSLIVFEHSLWHEGANLKSGEKYILRSDIMYQMDDQKPIKEEKMKGPIYSLESRILDYSKPIKDNPMRIQGHSGYIWKVIKLSNGNLASGSRDKTIKIWDFETGKCKETLSNHRNSVLSLIQLSNGNLLSGSRDNTILEWKDGKCVSTINPESGNVLSLLEIPRLNFIAAGFSDHSIGIFKDQKIYHRLKGHEGWIWDLILFSDTILMSASEDGCIKFWNLESMELIKTIVAHDQSVNKIVKHSKNICISGSSDKSIKIWNIEKSECLRSLSGHEDYVRDLELLNDELLASGSEDGTIKIWNIKTGECISTLQHSNYVKSILRLPDGKIVSGSYDANISVWDFEPK
eukprot:gene7013-11178_t